VQVLEWQGLKAHNAPEDWLLAGDHLSHFLAIFEVFAFTSAFDMMRDSWTFKIAVGQLSESLLNHLSDAIFKYTVPLRRQIRSRVAFLVLPEGHHFTSELRRKKSFVPISTDPGKRRKSARRKILAAVAGFVFGPGSSFYEMALTGGICTRI